MSKLRREKPRPRTNPSGKRAYVAYVRPPGSREKEYLGTRSLEREAQALIDDWYDARDAGRPTGRTRLGTYAEDWLDRFPRSERTNRTNAFRLTRALDVEIEDRKLADWPLADLRRRHVTVLQGKLLAERGYAVVYVRGILAALSAMVENAIDPDELLGSNPFKGVKLHANDPRAADRPPREDQHWSAEQMHYFASCAGPYEPMVRMLADCGFRLGELFALVRGLQDLKRGVFKVKGSAWNGKVVPTSREKNHDRIGPIPPAVVAMLLSTPARIDVPWLFPSPGGAHTRKPRITWPPYAELAAEVETTSYKAVSRRLGVSDNAVRNHLRRYAPDAPPLAPSDGGKLWRAENFYRDVWTPTCDRAGFRPTPKEFRSSLNTNLLTAGINRADVADMLGHSEDVNAERYTRALRRSGDEIREALA